jgi:hypothetical protein
MSSPKPLHPWQILRPLLSVFALLLLPLLWGDEGCGRGPRTGFQLFGAHSAFWIIPLLSLIATSEFIARRMRADLSLGLRLVVFLGAMYLGLSSFIHLVFLHRQRWPAPVCTLIVAVLLVDCARQLILSVATLGRTSSTENQQPMSPLRQLGWAIGLIAGIALLIVPRGCSWRSPRSAQSVEPKQTAVKLGPPRPLPFANRAAFTETTDQRAPIFGQLPFITEVPMWRGTVFHSTRGPGFGRHFPRATYLLQSGDWLLVHADSGLWLLETETLARRARLNTGAVAAVDVARGGARIAYASCGGQDDAWRRPCDLVVLSFPELTELHRSEIEYPSQLRFSPNAKLIAMSRGHFSGATVIEVGGQALFSSRLLSSSVAAVPISEKRLAYLDDSGRLAIEEANRKEALFLGRPDPPVMTFPFKLGMARGSGELVFDEAGDRVLEVGQSGALTLEGVRGEKPHPGKPLTGEELTKSGLRHGASNHSAEELDARFNVKQFRYEWHLDGVLGFVGRRGEVVGNYRDHIIRVTREGISRSVDFNEGESSQHTSFTKADLLFWHAGIKRVSVRRAQLGTAALDYEPELVGDFPSEYEPRLLLFPDGARAFIAIDERHHATLVRLPRGGKLAPAEPLPLNGLHSPRSQSAGDGRYAFLVEDGQVLEISAQKTQILVTDGHWPEQLSFDEKTRCFALADHRKRRLLGADCAGKAP